MKTALPISVRYVKNGRGGQWWPEAQKNEQVHLGWKTVPKGLLKAPDFDKLRKIIQTEFGSRRGATQDFNALRELLDSPSRHLWITFEDGYMWWCTVVDRVTVNPEGESLLKGNFWLTCSRRWSNRSLSGKLLAVSDLPGTVTTTGGFQGTVCTPRDWEAVIRIIRDEKDPDVAKSAAARTMYREAVHRVVKRLSWRDFEQLIELILARTEWVRVSTLDKTREGIDIEVENLMAAELAFVRRGIDLMLTQFWMRRDFVDSCLPTTFTFAFH